MPRIRRWFPVSQDINTDPEVWELTDRFGDRALRVWLEILSIGDRNDGWLPGAWQSYPRLLAGRCKSTTNHLSKVCEWLERWLLINADGVARIHNHAKYHITRDANKIPSGISIVPLPSEPSEPSEPLNLKNPDPAPPEPSADSLLNNEKPETEKTERPPLDPRIKEAADKIYMTDPKRYARLIAWITAGLRTYSAPVIATSLEKFYPYATEKMDWWPYLDKILDKTEAQTNARNTEVESENYKKQDAATAETLLRGFGIRPKES